MLCNKLTQRYREAQGIHKLISEEYKFVFLRLPKTAGRTVAIHLRAFCNAPVKRKLHKLYIKDRKIGWFCKHWTYKQLKSYKPYAEDFFWFSFVRNPWDRVASYYMERHKKRKKYLDRKDPLRKFHNYFPEALKREKETVQASEYDWNLNTQRESRKKGKNERIGEYSPLMEQMRYLTFDGSTNSDKISVDFIGRYENLNQHFNDIVTKIGLPDDLKLKRTIGANQHKLPYCEFYTQECIDIVAEVFKHDIEYFNYDYVERQ